jgi:dCTP deaminase
MILCDWQIRDYIDHHRLVDPCQPEQVNPASVDLTLGSRCVFLNSGVEYEIAEDYPLLLAPGFPVVVTTAEVVNFPATLAGELVLKSSMGRQGVDMCKAGWIDPGFCGTLSVTLYSHIPAKLKPGQRFVQMKLYRMDRVPDAPYRGRYQNQVGPTLARPEGK